MITQKTADSVAAQLPDAQYDEFVLRGQLPATPGPLWFKVQQLGPSGQLDWAEVPASGTSTPSSRRIDTATRSTTNTSARMVNLSARTNVGTGGSILIAGFAIQGDAPKQLLIRAVGPSLTQFGVTGVLVMSHPARHLLAPVIAAAAYVLLARLWPARAVT